MIKITGWWATQKLNSLGFPTLGGTIYFENNEVLDYSIGSETENNTQNELRDNEKSFFNGLGLKKAINYINNLIVPRIKGVSPVNQKAFDQWLETIDNTEEKFILGQNTIYFLSVGFFLAGAKVRRITPFQYINQLVTESLGQPIELKSSPAIIDILVSKKNQTKSNFDFSEFFLITPSNKTTLETTSNYYHIRKEFKKLLFSYNANDLYSETGNFVPNLNSDLDTLELIAEAINKCGYKLGYEIFIGLNISPKHFFKENRYHLKTSQNAFDQYQFEKFITNLKLRYKLFFIEEPFANSDLNSWKNFFNRFNKEIYIAKNLNKSLFDNLTKNEKLDFNNAIICPQEFLTITNFVNAVAYLKKIGLSITISSRLAETESNYLSDIAFGIQADFFKLGSLIGSQWANKINRLLEIEKQT